MDYKDVYFKDDEARKKWLDFIDKNPEEACNVLIGRNIKLLENLASELAQAFDKETAFNKLSNEEKKVAFTILEAAEKYEPQIANGELQFNKKSQSTLNAVSSAVLGMPETSAIVIRAQEALKEIEFLVKTRDDIGKTNLTNENKTKVADKSEMVR